MKRRKTGRRTGGRRRRLVLGTFLVLVAGVAVWLFLPSKRPPVPSPAAPAPPIPHVPPSPTPGPLGADFEAAGRTGGVLALVVDDLGYEDGALQKLSALDVPLSVAVIPAAPHAQLAAREAHVQGWDLLVHLPMDGTGPPEKGSIGSKDDEETIRQRTLQSLELLPAAIGINNHQGSAATADPRVMRAVLSVVKERHLFFLDSRTTSASVAVSGAQALGVPVLARDVFLDDAAAEAAGGGPAEAMEEAWKRALRTARTRGACVLITHPRPSTLDFLAARLPKLKSPRLIRVSELVD